MPENSDVLLASVAVLVRTALPLSRAVRWACVRLASGMVNVNRLVLSVPWYTPLMVALLAP